MGVAAFSTSEKLYQKLCVRIRVLNTIQEANWVRAEMVDESLLVGCVFRSL